MKYGTKVVFGDFSATLGCPGHPGTSHTVDDVDILYPLHVTGVSQRYGRYREMGIPYVPIWREGAVLDDTIFNWRALRDIIFGLGELLPGSKVLMHSMVIGHVVDCLYDQYDKHRWRTLTQANDQYHHDEHMHVMME